MVSIIVAIYAFNFHYLTLGYCPLLLCHRKKQVDVDVQMFQSR
jgi:hypothetical protein